jgi:hypothetical protein
MPYIGNPIYQSAFVTDQFSGNGSTTAFTMSVAPAGVSNVLVAVSGVLQDPSTYGVVGTTLTFTSAPPPGTGNISVRYLGVPVTGVTTTAYRTITEFTATAGQTTFTPPSYTVGYISVFLNGVLLGSADYTASNGTTVVLATGASAGNILTTESFYVSSVLNAIPNTAGSVSSSNIQTSVTLTTPTIDKINTSVTNTSLGAGNSSIMKNRIINGAMTVSQYNGTSSVTPTASAYVIDRFTFATTQASKVSFQQNAGSVTPPAGFSNYLGATSLSAYSVASGDFLSIAQYVEGFNTADLGWGTANAKTVTLSFQVYSSLTGTFGGAIANNAFNRSYPFTYTISTANTWTTVSVTIAGDTSGTWVGATNGIGLRLYINLGTGSTYSGTAGSWSANGYTSATGATSVVGTNGATFYITGVQLEVGSSATGFEYVNYQTSLANCQRYFVKLGGNDANELFGVGIIQASNNAEAVVNMPVRMRANPTASISGTAANFGVTGPTGFTPSAISFDIYGPLTLRLSATISGATAGNGAYVRAGGSTVAGINISAEL